MQQNYQREQGQRLTLPAPAHETHVPAATPIPSLASPRTSLKFGHQNSLYPALESLFLTFIYWSAFGIPGALAYYGNTKNFNFDPKKFIGFIALGPVSLIIVLAKISNRRTSSSIHRPSSLSSTRPSHRRQTASRHNSQVTAQQSGEPRKSSTISSIQEQHQNLSPKHRASQDSTKDTDNNKTAPIHDNITTSTPDRQETSKELL